MTFVAFDVDGAERAGGAQVFAGTAADAAAFVNKRNLQRCRVVSALGNHRDRAGRTMPGTVVAADLVAVNDAEVFFPDCVADLNR